MKTICVLIIAASLSFADDFKSIAEIRNEMDNPKYGPSLGDVLPFDLAQKIKIVACVGYKTEAAISEDYAYSNLSIAGRKYTYCKTGIKITSAEKLLDAVRDFSNYGDIQIGVFKPNIAIEIICGRETFVVNFCEDTKTFNLSSSKTSNGLELAHWSKPLRASPALIGAIYECLKSDETK